MDSPGIEPGASRMLSGCDTTTPTALLKEQAKMYPWSFSALFMRKKALKFCVVGLRHFCSFFFCKHSFTIHHSPFIIHHPSSFTNHHSPFIIHHSSFITHHSSFITHHSSLTIHHSPFIIHHSSFPIYH